jgi:hypothetical protein
MKPSYRPAKKLLSVSQEQEARAAFAAGSTRDAVARLLGIGRSTLDARLRDQLADIRTGQGRNGGRRVAEADPTEEQIRLACEAIRSGWSEERWAQG